MAFVDSNLMPGERVVARARLHWIVFLRATVLLVLSLLLLGRARQTWLRAPILLALPAVFVVLTAVSGLSAYIDYATFEFAVTNKRVMAKVGFVRRKSLEVLLSKVEAIAVNQGVLGRLLDYGSVVVSGTGGSRDPFHRIASPLEFRRNTQEQIELLQGRS